MTKFKQFTALAVADAIILCLAGLLSAAAGHGVPLDTGPIPHLELLSALSMEHCDQSSRFCPPPSTYTAEALSMAASGAFSACRPLALSLKRKGLRRDTLARFALSLSGVPELKPLAAFEQYHGAERITPGELGDYLKCLRSPETVAAFGTFFSRGERDLIQAGRDGAACADASAAAAAAVAFFGYAPRKFIFAPAMTLRGKGAWGGSLNAASGTEVYALYGYAPGMYRDCGQLRAIARHEFAHGMVSYGLADEKLRAAPLTSLFSLPKLLLSGYTSGESITEEYLVRAVSLILAEKAGQSMEAAAELDLYKKSGFPDMDRFTAILREYDGRRNDYPDFKAFKPRLEDFLRQYEKRARTRLAVLSALAIAAAGCAIFLFKSRKWN